MKNRSKIKVSLVAALGFLLLAGARAQTGDQAETVTIWLRPDNVNFVNPLIKEYNRTHKTQVKAEVVPADQLFVKLATAVVSKQTPDLVAVDLVYLPALSKAKLLTDITRFSKTVPNFSQLSPSHIRLGTYEEKLYAMPFSAEGSFLLYNKDLFRQAGLDPNKPPKTRAEIEAYSKKITALGKGVKGFYIPGACSGYNVFTFLPLIWAQGGDVLNKDGTASTLNSDAVRGALGLYQRLWKTGQMPARAKTDGCDDLLGTFLSGKVGMITSGAFSLGVLKTKYPKMKVGTGYLPGQDGGWSSFAGGDSIAIPRGSKNVDAAFDFITWALQEKQQIEYFAKNGSMPVRTNLASNKYSKTDARLVLAAKAMSKGRTPYSVVYEDLFNGPNSAFITMMRRSIFDGDIDGAIKAATVQFNTRINR